MRSKIFVHAAAVIALLAAGPVAAQLQPAPRILYSAPLMLGNQYVCTVINVSPNPVTLQQLRFDTLDGPIHVTGSCGGLPTTMEPGKHCSATLRSQSPFAGLVTVGCRVKHAGGELLGSLQGIADLGGDTAPYLAGVSQLRFVGFTAAP